MSAEFLKSAVLLAGVGQLVLAAASLAIPSVLGWKAELMKLRPLTRQVFWTYAGYIWSTNVAFGLASVFMAKELLERSHLAACVTEFIALYWVARCVIQWCYFDRSDAPQGWHVRLAEFGLNGLFVLLTATYAAATWWNLHGGLR